MRQTTLTTHVEKAQEALTALLKTLMGTEVPIEADEPESVEDPDGESIEEWFALHAEEADAVVALNPAWVQVLSEAMLGEALEPDSEGATDLMQEVAAQGFGTVQSTLAAEGLELPAIQFEAAVPGEGPSALEGSYWRVEFAADRGGEALKGVVLVPDRSGDSGEEASTSAASGQGSGQPARQQTAGAGASSGGGSEREPSDVEVSPASFSELGDEDFDTNGDGPNNFELLAEVNLEIRVELGRRELPLADVLKLTTGSVVELEKMVGEPLSVYANGRLIAEGEAVVIDEQFGVRITNLASEGHREKAFF